jgi:hypothetical protein
MSIPPSADALSMTLFMILLACVLGLVGFVWIKLGGRPRALDYRGLQIRLNPGLPQGKIVLTDGKWQPIGETDARQFDRIALPQGCTAAWLSTKDFAALAARKADKPHPLSEHSLQA